MAEFQEVMKQIKRICKANDYKCTDCPMSTQSFCQMSAFDMEGFETIENIVMAWAAEHPEPVYPTWGEWFVEHGDLVDGWQNATNAAWMANTALSIFMNPIPPDIAEKLGLQPKEVYRG